MKQVNIQKMDIGNTVSSSMYKTYWLSFSPANCIPRRIPLDLLLNLYDSCAYHSSPIHKKARAAFARGLKIKNEPTTLKG